MKILKLFPLLLLATFLFFAGGCKKDNISTDGSLKLRFQTDTLTFDTIFTQLPSTTKRLKIFNDSKNKVSISSIDLGGGANSVFRINVDGVAGPHRENVEINAKDSIYIFVEVTVNTNNQNNPLLITDSIQFVTNGNHQKVILAAAGQDSHIIVGQKLSTQNWVNDKPYVIINSALVDSNATLNIQAGCRIYFSNGSGLFVKGKLVVQGTCADSVTFRGLRLEEFYKDVPGQWAGIFILRGAQDCTIEHAVIKNSTYGLNMGSSASDDLTTFTALTAVHNINSTIIKNSLSTAVYCTYANANFKDCLIYNAGDNMINLVFGGTYNLDQCTMVNYGSTTLNHEKALLQMGNIASNTTRGQIGYTHPFNAQFRNVIMDGSLDEEFLINDSTTNGASPFLYRFTNSIVKTKTSPPTDTLVNCLKNTDPLFKNRGNADFHLVAGSPCINFGVNVSVPSDLDCKSYNQTNTPTIGCYEVQ